VVAFATVATLDGTLERVVFQNQDTLWTVARLAPAGGGELVTVVGALLGVAEGTPLRLHGDWVDDARYGRQFKVSGYQLRNPETRAGIERFLGSGLIPGIGAELARRIVDKFGLETLEIIDRDVSRLAEVEGIGRARLDSIAAAWAEQRATQDVMVFLGGLGVPAALAQRIRERWGADAVAVVRQNPYRLVEIWGIGFRTADGIARKLGITGAAPARVEAGVVHVLEELAEDGHTFAPEEHLVDTAARLLEVDPAAVGGALDRLGLAQRIVREPLGDRGRCAALAGLWREEAEAALALAALAATPPRQLRGDADAAIAEFETVAAIELAAEQRRAVTAAVRDKCVVITGGPGVGKTTIVRAIVRIFIGQQRAVALAAPTGRAAKRLAEATGAEARTIHRLLEFQPQTGGFLRNAADPLEVDAVIVDEASMIDVALFRALLVALPPAAQLVLVGDVDQLPSVGPGAVLADVIASGAATVIRLTEIYRQAAASRIVVSAHQVNRGQLPDLDPPPGDGPARSDFYFVARDDPAAALATVVELVAERIPSRFGLDPVADVQVLTPMHRGDLGTVALNAALQARLNPTREGAAEARRGERAFRAGDKVMQVRNDYDKDVFNGDIGVVESITDGGGVTIRLLDGRRATWEATELDQLIHAYAVSVHKSQGSEYPAVVLPLVTQHYMMLQRNLLYTAITRGKRLVVLVGSRKAVAMAVRNDETRKRWTWLAERIRGNL